MLSTPWGPSRQGAPGSPCSRRSKTASSAARGSGSTPTTWRTAELPGRFGDERPMAGHELAQGGRHRLPRRPVSHYGVGRRNGAVTFRHHDQGHAQPRPDGGRPTVDVAGRAASSTHPVCGMCCTQAVLLVPSHRSLPPEHKIYLGHDRKLKYSWTIFIAQENCRPRTV